MIQELVRLAERNRSDQPDQWAIHDALCKERLDAYICIRPDGQFIEIIPTEKKDTIAEDLVRTENKGRTSNVLARLVLDNEKYVLGLPEGSRTTDCMKAYLKKLHQYENVTVIKPVLNFYENNKEQGLKLARNAFRCGLESKQFKSGTNLSFLIRKKGSGDIVSHTDADLIDAIKKRYDENERRLKGSSNDACSVCGKHSYRARNLATHGTIDGVLPRNTLGNYLISYEGDAFASYGLEGNDNSLVCTHCAKAYVEAMNWLLAPRSWAPTEKKGKLRPVYTNRKDISDDTSVIFWLKKARKVDFLEMLENPSEETVLALFNSVYKGKQSGHIKSDTFYSMTLSGVAARIAVRDWIQTSLQHLQENLARWFQDTELLHYGDRFFPFWMLVKSTGRFTSSKPQGDQDERSSCIGTMLWRCAVLGHSPPLWLIHAVLDRIRAEQSSKADEGKKLSPWEMQLSARVALLKLYVNRKPHQQGGTKLMAALDESNDNIAYICGRLFAVLESIQYHALGSEINAGIRERFFSFASTMPSTAFGRLMKMTQHHLSKIRGEKPGLAVNLDKKLGELMSRVQGTRLPPVFSLEDQASFAIGYYHQRHQDFTSTKKED
jgi:CRISPR-associated protein Csd1